jgi:hypothetical protein
MSVANEMLFEGAFTPCFEFLETCLHSASVLLVSEKYFLTSAVLREA